MRFLKNLGAAICVVGLIAVFLAAFVGICLLFSFLNHTIGLIPTIIIYAVLAAVVMAIYWTIDGDVMY